MEEDLPTCQGHPWQIFLHKMPTLSAEPGEEGLFIGSNSAQDLSTSKVHDE